MCSKNQEENTFNVFIIRDHKCLMRQMSFLTLILHAMHTPRSELGKREKKLSRTSKQEYTCSPFDLDYRSDMITVQRSCTAMKQYGDIVMDKD